MKEKYSAEYGEGHEYDRMIETGATCQRNMFSEVKIAIKCNTKFTYSFLWQDAMTKAIRRQEMSTFAALSGCTYTDEICFVGIEL